MSGPRYSIIPGDFAEDARADVNHFRVINLIGRHTNSHGWCRLKQGNMATALGLTRETVNRKLADLVLWGYVEKRAIDATGRAIFYRTVMDRHAPPTLSADDDDAHFLDVGPVSDGSHVGCNSEGTCEEQITPGVIASVTPGVIAGNHNKNDLSLTTKSPPNPPEGGSSADDWKGQVIAALRAEGRYGHGIEHFIVPLLATLHRFSLGKDRVGELRDIARRASGVSVDALKAAVKRLADQSHKLTPRRILREIETAQKLGAMVVIKRGTVQWQRWLEHFRTEMPDAARVMGLPATTSWQVPAEWPPAKSERGAA
jgi:hypothetical protein